MPSSLAVAMRQYLFIRSNVHTQYYYQESLKIVNINILCSGVCVCVGVRFSWFPFFCAFFFFFLMRQTFFKLTKPIRTTKFLNVFFLSFHFFFCFTTIIPFYYIYLVHFILSCSCCCCWFFVFSIPKRFLADDGPIVFIHLLVSVIFRFLCRLLFCDILYPPCCLKSPRCPAQCENFKWGKYFFF